MKENQLTIPNNLNQLVSSLQVIKPDNSETVQIITYILLATAIIGIFVYNYMKQQELQTWKDIHAN